MAEPLLKRTLSRLRGRDRTRRKKLDGKDGDHHQPGSDPDVSPEPPTSHKQNRVHISSHHHPPKTPLERLEPNEEDGNAPLSPMDPNRDEGTEGEEDSDAAELCGPGRSPGHGAYLQSLERSSRQWVLSAGKGTGWDEMNGINETEPGAAGREGEIWYNPIPEDEDPTELSSEERKGTEQEPAAGSKQDGARTVTPSVSSCPPRSPHPIPRLKTPGTVRRLSVNLNPKPLTIP
ncbi:rho GTPase-activating protein SYDE1-like isoform X3 [Coturnix japonica]|uniref:rho GTPase-activating protein SYDE1-like isoform X3 n=1 Tax=Coturnix japonica TaxID=93934 RepID=UPI000777F1C8|nr:rho GTPase-activating protein SYDE1-like isoform X3 [Coturnix japonica]